ncbi:YidC/Oxa1 family membrane protein insertase [Mesorhizobium sp. AaZ16]|uniref:YidC/Oxa1 family membrane protein insertase n=1 Tax=Mesorhizobium sp. AaZ16 TaxID=3402289 RepID=UPI00374FD9CE
MGALSIILWPIIAPMGFVLDWLHHLSGSYGVAIILLSALVRMVTLPLSKIGRRHVECERLVQLQMQPALAEAKARYSGRERFERIEGIYASHQYHPIHSMASLLPLLIQIPFLLAALFLLTDHPSLAGERFLFIRDLAQPDRLLSLGQGVTVNLLPILLTAVAVIESAVAANATRLSRLRFLIIAVVLLVLIYPLPAAVCLYWMASNAWSLIATLRTGRGAGTEAAIELAVRERRNGHAGQP